VGDAEYREGQGDRQVHRTPFFHQVEGCGSGHVKVQLGDFAGTLLSDNYVAYDTYAKSRPEVTQAQCWAHTRRCFERAQDSDQAAREALELIGALYRIEVEIRDRKLVGQAKLDYRARHSHPVVEAFFAWCHTQRQRIDLVNSDPLAKKNWLINWTEVGAQRVGIIQSLLTTCRLQGVDPYTYLVDVLQRISLHPAREVGQLTPRRWKTLFGDNLLRSDLDHAH
jgi:hypothetical protein